MCLGGPLLPSLSALVELSGEGDRFTLRCDGTDAVVVEDREVPPDGALGVGGVNGAVRALRGEVLDPP